MLLRAGKMGGEGYCGWCLFASCREYFLGYHQVMRQLQMGRFAMFLLLLIPGFFLGLGVGFYLWGQGAEPASGRDVTPITRAEPERPSNPVAELIREPGPFEKLEAQAIGRIGSRDYAGAIEVLFEAEMVARTEREVRQLTSLLEEAVKLRVIQLRGLNHFNAIDALYEDLTLAMPERAEYYILLAEFRVEMNNPEAALPVLAQIENHHQLGGRARELIDSITRVSVSADAPLASIPLIRSGDQFLVEARLDETSRVTLLIDTGASMTVISPNVLSALGYSLDGRTANFSTANGQVVAPLVSLASLNLGESRVAPLTVGAISLDRPGRYVDGLLGMDFLRRFEFSVDQDGGMLKLLSRRDN
jgi:clan AA aspartic protease (TIGR02281 family)